MLAVMLLCTPRVLADDAFKDESYSYQKNVRPILEKNCVVCHACYDAPCQLKMESFEGLSRGATKAVVYTGRPKAQDPTRLHIDAADEAGWRAKGFFSVIEGGSSSILSRMIELGRKQAPKANQPLPDEVEFGVKRENQCPTGEEFEKYQHRKMHQGMPFGMAPLRPETLYTLHGWLAEGAPVDETDETLSAETQKVIGAWEGFLNASDKRGQLLARYIYEHLFLAHLHFDAEAMEGFFEIVRSSTSPGSPIQVIPTRRPNDDPGGTVFYRLRRIKGAIVQKTHITYPFGLDKLKRVQKLFSSKDWDVKELPPYSATASTNPFVTFQAIPASLRYQYMLDNAHYFVQCFIRGPVCLGNIATDVIQDHFHAMFTEPQADLFCLDADYAKKAMEHLNIRGKEGFRVDVRPQWMEAEQRYAEMRFDKYKSKDATSLDEIWHGEGTNPDAMLTVFRNHDSATVLRGLRGILPKTIWVIDYPILERIYYLLVVNFDVFGSAVHQVQTRLYFDLLRAESETNFLRFLPAGVRKKLRKSWYRGLVATMKVKTVYPSVDRDTPSLLEAEESNPMAEFVDQLRTRMPALTGLAGDMTGNSFAEMDAQLDATMRDRVEGTLMTLEQGTATEYPFINFLPNVSLIRIGFGEEDRDLAYTIMLNRVHKNVAFMLREGSRLEPEKDYLTVLRGPVGSYPNFIFQVASPKVDDFVKQLQAVKDAEGFTAVVNKYGVRRTHPSFWDAFQFFSKYLERVNPLQRGIFDANRYENY